MRQSTIQDRVREEETKAESALFPIALVNMLLGTYFGLVLGSTATVNSWMSVWNSTQQGLFAAAPIIGATVGSMLGSMVAEALGRIKTFRLIAVLGFGCSAIGAILWEKFWPHFIVRLPLGFAIGLTVVVGPLYVTELAPEKYRGPFGTFLQLFICNGLMLGAALAPIIELLPLKVVWMLTLSAIPALGMFINTFFLPESPTWLAESLFKKSGATSENLATERDGLLANAAPPPSSTGAAFGGDFLGLPGMATTGYLADNASQVSIADINTGAKRKAKVDRSFLPIRPLIVGIVLATGQQLTGINAVVNFAPKILSAANIPPFYANLGFSVWNFLASAFAVYLVSMVPRRRMFLISLFVCSISWLFMGVCYLLRDGPLKAGGLVLGVVTFVGAFENGLGPLFFVLATEIWPTDARDLGCSICNLLQFLFNILMVVIFPLVSGALENTRWSQSPLCLAFGLVGLFSFAVLFLMLPETSKVETYIAGETPHHVAVVNPTEGIMRTLSRAHKPADFAQALAYEFVYDEASNRRRPRSNSAPAKPTRRPVPTNV